MEEILSSLIGEAVKKVSRKPPRILPPILLESPKYPSHGHLTTSIALKLSRELQRPAEEIARSIVAEISSSSFVRKEIAKIEVRPPGFINFFLSASGLARILWEIQKEGRRFGNSSDAKRKKIQIEFVSANPTGPLSVAHGRQAAVGDSLANILSAAGARVIREYYINDEGVQIDLLGASVRARCAELLGIKEDFPPAGYRGRYIYDIASGLIARFGKEKIKRNISRGNSFFSRHTSGVILTEIKKDLLGFGVNFDIWFSQKKHFSPAVIERTLRRLAKSGYLYEQDGAFWFRSSRFGDDKDRVVKKSDGTYTYLAPDIAYHENKFRRGFEQVINLWGPDHHGYIPRLVAAVAALGIKKDSLVVLIIQLTTLYREGKPAPMSTRAGEFVTLREVVEEVGKDAARFFFLMRTKEAHLDFDLELAKKKSLENPVYYIQYAYARIRSIIEFARTRRLSLGKSWLLGAERSLLKTPEEIALLQQLRQFPEAVLASGTSLEPYRLVLYLQKLAEAFHRFYTFERVVGEDREVSRARLLLVDSTRIVLEKGLSLLGISSPRQM